MRYMFPTPEKSSLMTNKSRHAHSEIFFNPYIITNYNASCYYVNAINDDVGKQKQMKVNLYVSIYGTSNYIPVTYCLNYWALAQFVINDMP